MLADTRLMAWQDTKQPWWERPAKAPGEPHYEPEREHLRAELARAWRADVPAQGRRRPGWWGVHETRRAA